MYSNCLHYIFYIHLKFLVCTCKGYCYNEFIHTSYYYFIHILRILSNNVLMHLKWNYVFLSAHKPTLNLYQESGNTL